MNMSDSSAQAFPAVFVRQVEDLLEPEARRTLEKLRYPSAPSSESLVAFFLNELFARATPEIIRIKTPGEVAFIANSCCRVLRSLPSSPDRIALDLEQRGDRSFLFIASDDRPFIISSIAERLSDAGASVIAFLHPILPLEERAIALSYVEFGDSGAVDTARLLPRLQETLQTLKQVVLDFDPMESSVSHASLLLSSSPMRTEFGEMSSSEVQAFLSWLNDGSFFFVGSSMWDEGGKLLSIDQLGAWKVAGRFTEQLRSESAEDLKALVSKGQALSIRKLRLTSPVHRPATLLNIMLRLPKSPGHVFSVVGYLTSKAWTHEAQDIPILRHKVSSFLALDGAIPNSHDYKYLVEVVDNMPTDEALACPTEQLRLITRLALGVFSHEETRTLSFVDELRRRAFSLVVLPPERFSASVQQLIQDRIEEALEAARGSSEIHLDSSKRRQYRLYLSTPLPPNHSGIIPQDALHAQIPFATLTWEEKLAMHLAATGEVDWRPEDFPTDYQAGTSVEEAAFDARHIASISAEKPVTTALYLGDRPNALPVVSIFSRGIEISISKAIAVLENIGIEVLRAHSYACRLQVGRVNILKLISRPYDGQPLSQEQFHDAVNPGLSEILVDRAVNDPLNLLLRRIPVSIGQISLLRCYCALLWQVQKMSTKRTMWKALAQAPNVALHLIRMFELKFSPALGLSIEERSARSAEEEALMAEALRFVPDITHDRVLRAILSLVKNTIRTNFYHNPAAIALKLTPRNIEIMPHPRPLFEIFVFSQRIEGTHLRSAKVARGGIRWSERLEDFRSEVLGLMKTQRVKNVIIVPSGAKGGFILKSPPKDAESLPKAVEHGYREYITALLTLADNKQGEAVVHPAGLVVYDEPDPYFVVAADKGTATFSDVANEIAQRDFKYWLGDAFASGGSAGYDHKKYGITAKGGWECVERHFRDLGIDYIGKPFTVVGIGDMSGDVFGNALILSASMRLVAAFNHKHIFIDPNPDLRRSLEERIRLFNAPRTQWSDYSPALISAGGGVFNRFDKEIQLTPEIRAALGLGQDVPNTIDGESLISHILRAPVELLWNGGIGTYVKARSESQADVNDGTNDAVRINADELRARVVGEGGNLGFTQKARIEFSQRGGRINTDAIDNSGGVDLSDHEVNLKLLFSPLVEHSKLTTEQRNSALKEIAPQVVESVLKQNRDQSLLLSISAIRSKTTMEQYRYLIRDMNRLGFLDRTRDALPDEQEIDERNNSQAGLTRPELAVCSAATKMWVKEEIRSSRLCSDKSLEPFLISYFPPQVTERFRDSVLQHPLRTDIIASCVVNEIIPVVGIPFVHSITSGGGTHVPAAVKCILAADSTLGAKALRERIRALDTVASCPAFTELWLDVGSALREASVWLLNTHGSQLSLVEMVELYAASFDTLAKNAQQVFTGQELSRFNRRVEQYRGLGASAEDSIQLALYRRVISVLEVLWSSREFSQDVTVVAAVYSQVLEELAVNTLFKYEQIVESANKWESELVAASYQDIRRNLSLLTGKLLKKGTVSGADVAKTLRSSAGFDAVRATMSDVEEGARLKRAFQVAVLPVISRQLRLLSV